MPRLIEGVIWLVVALLGAVAFAFIALARGETISAAWLVVAGLCSYAVAYRFYARFIAHRVFDIDVRRATPADRLENGRDFVPTSKKVDTPLNKIPMKFVDARVSLDEFQKWEKLYAETFTKGAR